MCGVQVRECCGVRGSSTKVNVSIDWKLSQMFQAISNITGHRLGRMKVKVFDSLTAKSQDCDWSNKAYPVASKAQLFSSSRVDSSQWNAWILRRHVYPTSASWYLLPHWYPTGICSSATIFSVVQKLRETWPHWYTLHGKKLELAADMGVWHKVPLQPRKRLLSPLRWAMFGKQIVSGLDNQ
jgi:hypothetical protein